MLIASMTYEEIYREIRSDFRDLSDAIVKDQLKFHPLAKRAKKYPYGLVYEWKHPKSHNTYTYFIQVKRHSDWNKEPRIVIFTEFDEDNGKTTIAIVDYQYGNIRISIFRPHFFNRYYERNLTTIKGDKPETEREIKLAFLSRTSTVVFLGKKVVTQNELEKEDSVFENDAMLTTEGLIFIKRLKANPNITLMKTYVAPEDLYDEQFKLVTTYAIDLFYRCASKDSPKYQKSIDEIYLNGINELNSLWLNQELPFEEKQQLRIKKYQEVIDKLYEYII